MRVMAHRCPERPLALFLVHFLRPIAKLFQRTDRPVLVPVFLLTEFLDYVPAGLNTSSIISVSVPFLGLAQRNVRGSAIFPTKRQGHLHKQDIPGPGSRKPLNPVGTGHGQSPVLVDRAIPIGQIPTMPNAIKLEGQIACFSDVFQRRQLTWGQWQNKIRPCTHLRGHSLDPEGYVRTRKAQFPGGRTGNFHAHPFKRRRPLPIRHAVNRKPQRKDQFIRSQNGFQIRTLDLQIGYLPQIDGQRIHDVQGSCVQRTRSIHRVADSRPHSRPRRLSRAT